MPAPVVHEPALQRPLSLVAFACQVWLQQLSASRNVTNEAAVGSWNTMLTHISTDAETHRRLRNGFDALNMAAKKQAAREAASRQGSAGLSATEREQIRYFIRALDDHLVRIHPERVAHLLSFYSSLDVSSAADYDWVDPSAFASAWAAGPSRSKYEILDRGRQAAALARQLGDRLPEELLKPVRPASPYDPGRTLQDLLKRTCNELIGVASLPPTSGAGAATRYLALIGEIALDEIERHLFGQIQGVGDGEASARFGSAAAWRLPRVLTRIGEIAAQPAVAKAVWGPSRSVQVVARARLILRRLLAEGAPNINRPRSLIIEAYRYLGGKDPELRKMVTNRLATGRAAVTVDGVPTLKTPFGERGLLSHREQCYAAYVLYEENPESRGEIVEQLREPVRQKLFTGRIVPIEAARRYAASVIEYIDRYGNDPPLAAFRLHAVPTGRRRARTTGAEDGSVEDWYAIADRITGAVDTVRAPVEAVWTALRSAADGEGEVGSSGSTPWSRQRDHVRRVRHPEKVDEILKDVPRHARLATRSLVAQGVLSIDGTARREAVEALRQAGLADVAAGLFELVVDECRSIRGTDEHPNGHPLDWLLEQAVFCLSYTGSLRGFNTLVREALPDNHAETEGWIRTTALLGLADLGDVVHDAEDENANARVDLLLDRIQGRLLQLGKDRTYKVRVGEKDTRRTDQLRYVEQGEELRGLVAVLAMLRSEKDQSVKLLHLLSGRYFEETQDAEGKTLRDPRPLADRRAPLYVRGAAPEFVQVEAPREEWVKDLNKMKAAAQQWDLLAWQLAEWGLTRIENRFRPPEEAGCVRVADPLTASHAAERRMRDFLVAPPQHLPAVSSQPELKA